MKQAPTQQPIPGQSKDGTSPSPRAGAKARILVVCLGLALATLAVYWPVTGHEFINYDDPFYVTDNPHVRGGLSWEGMRWAITAMHASNWHPLTWLSHMLDCTVFGLNARGHHVTNLALHTANALLLFLVLGRLTGALWRSAVVAGLFALHPLHVESVAWVSERKDVLSTFFGLLALGAYGRHVKKPEIRSPRSEVPLPNPAPGSLTSGCYWLALLFFALSLLSKPMLVTLPCLLLLLDYWPLQRFKLAWSTATSRTARWLILEKLPFFALSAASCVLTVLAQSKGGSVAPVDDVTLEQRLANSVIAYGWYVVKLFWPVDLAIIYPLFPTRPIGQIVGASALVTALTAAALWQARRRPPVFVGWFWFAGLLVPVIGLVQVGMQAYADRYTYLPYVGLFIVVAWAAAELAGTRRYRRASLAAAALLAMFACGLITHHQTRHWKDAETVFTHAISVTESNYIAFNNLGFAQADRRAYAEAIQNYQAALRAAPRYADAFNNLGCAYLGLKQTEPALDAFRQALSIKPIDARIRNNFGSALHDVGRYADAIAEYEAVLSASPEYADAHYNLANSLSAVGRRAEARRHYERAIAVRPDYAEAHHNLALDLLAAGETDAALRHSQRAVASKPDWFPAHSGLAAALKALNQLEEAARQYRIALQLQPAHPGTHYQLGMVLALQGKPAEARKEFSAATRLEPGDPEFQLALGIALEQEGSAAEAMVHYRASLRLRPDSAEALNNLAWILASHPDAGLRDGAEAVRLAEKACELTKHRQALLVGTLAAAYAEAGRFDDAVKTAETARALAEAAGDGAVAAKNQELLKLYRQGRPYRQGP